MNITGTLSIIELLWIAITTLGLVVSAANLMDAQESAEVAAKIPAREQGDRILKQIKVAVATEHVRAEYIYLAIHSAFFIIGGIAVISPPGHSADSETTSIPMIAAAILVPVVFFAFQIAMVINSRYVRKTRRFIIGLRALAATSTESKGTFDYKDTVGQPGEGTGTFSMKSEATKDGSRSAKDDPVVPEPEE